MLLRWSVGVPLSLASLLLQCSSFSLSSFDVPEKRSLDLLKRDGHHHHHKGAALTELNETEITMYHAPTPPSYYTLDFDNEEHESRHPSLMIMHGICMSLAFFVSLPMGIAMRSVKHAAHGLATLSFYGFCALGCAASGLYRKLTPNMYEHAVHRSQGYIIILITIALSALDVLAALQRFIVFLRSEDRSWISFWRIVVKQEKDSSEMGPEYEELVGDPEEVNHVKLTRDSVELQDVRMRGSDDMDTWANSAPRHHRRFSTMSGNTVFDVNSATNLSDDTLHDSKSHRIFEHRGILARLGQMAFMITERSLVLAGLGEVLIGIVTYTGGCRGNYVNGCLAHLIKGAIFWSYGLLTFGRFLGAFADRGWAWNVAPKEGFYTAEFVESLVIFTYGATNTWMERFGAHAGDPYTTKQIQHIGIAVMFFFAGAVGMGIESKMVRKWLAASAFSSVARPSEMPQEAVDEPTSYRGSFNPFPALVIGVTGAAMAAHVQTYLFQVQIHALWGNLLVAYAVLRCLTYFFLWLAPPKSILPSRPPTEALGSFFLACGGLVFMFSTEELTIAAMRRGRDDVMMFLNVAVAITCLAFCWTLGIVSFKGWLKSKSQVSVTFRNAA